MTLLTMDKMGLSGFVPHLFYGWRQLSAMVLDTFFPPPFVI
jgi:hypothetical protein